MAWGPSCWSEEAIDASAYLPGRRVSDAIPQFGDIVAIRPTISRFVPDGVFEVIKQLPCTGKPEHGIKSANEPHEHVARESELIKLRGAPSEDRKGSAIPR